MAQPERDMRQEWETPTAANTAHWKNPMPFFDVLDAEFGFQIDVCATLENRKCISYIGPEEDALGSESPWIYPREHRAWCNPGFSDPDPWMAKAHEQAQSHPDALVVVLGLPSLSSDWWRDWATKASEIRLIGGKRLQFVPAPGIKKSSSMRENCLFIFRRNPHNLPPHIWTWDWTA